MIFVLNIIDMQVTTISEASQQEDHSLKSSDEGSQ
jgi:hypothetical protein